VAGAHRIVVKTSLDNDIAGTFSEMGIFTLDRNDALGNFGSSMLSMCDSSESWLQYNGTDWVTNPNAADTVNDKNGVDAVVLTSSGSTVRYRLAGLDINLNEYNSTDQFLFASKITAGTLTSMTVRFNTDDNNYFSYTTPAFASTSYGRPPDPPHGQALQA
jgi:hypothetical protein